MITTNHIDHVGLAALYDFWNRLRGDRIAPSRADFTPSDLRQWLGNIILIDIHEETGRYFVRLGGSFITHDIGMEISGKFYDDFLDPAVYANIKDGFQKIIDSKQPFYFHGAFLEPPKRVRDFYRLILPLSSDGKTINMVMLGLYIRRTDQFPIDVNNLCQALAASHTLAPASS